ncbi:MAG: DUF922 domain-containing protein [Deltaproteobacteria bacterium]|nr:DUF922 domain-containing protein [Deltaproteobacteria bacterium]
MKKLRVFIAGLAASILLMPHAPALSMEPQRNDYEINGTTYEELSSQLISMLQDKVLDAPWEITWRYKERVNEYGCVPNRVIVDLKINSHVPRWPDSELAPERLRLKWGHFIDALNMHHAGHKDIATRAVMKIKMAIIEMQADDCARLRTNVDTMAHGVIRDARRQDAEYDILTENGELQGADVNILK